MKKYIVFTILCALSLLRAEAMLQPHDSIRTYTYSYSFDKEKLREDMKDLKTQIKKIKENMPDLSKFDFEFNDSVFHYYQIDTVGLGKLRGMAILDPKDLEEIRKMSENFRLDTAQFNRFRNFKLDTTAFYAFKGGQKPRTFIFKGGNNIQQNTPTRTETRTFSNISRIDIDHQYGSIVVSESNSKQVELQIQYFDAGNRKAVANISTANNTLNIKTSNSGMTSPKINYVITVPRNTAMNVKLLYGNIKIDDFHGAFSTDLTYSSLKADAFINKTPVISGKYGSVKIDDVNDIKIDASYTSVKIDKANRMELSGSYNSYNVDDVKVITSDSYVSGSFKIGSLDKIDGDMRYVSMVVDNLKSSFSTNCDYSNIKINSISPSVTRVDIKGRYSDVILSMPENASASFNISLDRGNFNVDRKYPVTYTEQSESTRQTVKKGQIGNKRPTTVINISNSYTNVKFR